MVARPLVNELRASIEEWAIEQRPDDGFTVAARRLTAFLSGILSWPMLVVQLIVNPLLSLVSIATLGIGIVPFIGLLWITNILTVGFSKLWIVSPISRPLIILPGSVIASLHSVYVPLLPYGGDWESRAEDMALPNVWPYSWHVQQLPNLRQETLKRWNTLKLQFASNEISAKELFDATYLDWQFLRRISPRIAEEVESDFEDMTSSTDQL